MLPEAKYEENLQYFHLLSKLRKSANLGYFVDKQLINNEDLFQY